MKSKKCLLVIDVQNGMFNLPRELYKGDIILDNIISLVEKARKENVIIIYMQHYGNENSFFSEGSKGWEIHSKVSPKGNDIVIEKTHSDSFQDTKLDEILKNNNIGDLVICGFVTEGCVDTAIRRANSLGYSLEVASNSHSTTDSNVLKAEQIISHHNEIFKIFSKVKKAEEIVFKAELSK